MAPFFGAFSVRFETPGTHQTYDKNQHSGMRHPHIRFFARRERKQSMPFMLVG